MADLITLARAKFNINQATFTSAEDDSLDALITAVSKAIKRYCRREFDSQSFDELYNGSGDEHLILNQYPILSVARVACNLTTVLKVRNTSASNQRATVALTSTGLTLVRVASGVATTDTSVTFAGNVTLQALADAINALANGWEAEAITDYALRASADLRALQGALYCKDRYAELKLHIDELSDYEVQANEGILVRGHHATEWIANLDWPTCSGWTPGLNNYRILYTAGYATVPEDVQEACAQWVASLFWQTKDNPAIYPTTPSTTIAFLLDPYRKHRI